MTAHRIEVWTVALAQAPESAWPALAALLDESEQARAARFVFDQHRREYTAAHALKRLMLSHVDGGRVAPRAWRFEAAERGKPRVDPPAGLHFNLSHCRGLVACAVSTSIELGLDVEWLDRKSPLEVVPNYFAPAEARWLHALPEAERTRGFFRIWTLKEAYIKATGLGLAQRLRDFAFVFDLSTPAISFQDAALGDARAWRFEQQDIGSEHLLALGWRGGAEPAELTRRDLRIETLLAEALRAR